MIPMLLLWATLAGTPNPQRIDVLCLAFDGDELGPIALTDGPQLRDGRVRWSRWDGEHIRAELVARGVSRDRSLAAMDFRLAEASAAPQQCGTCYLGIYYPAKQSCGRYYGQTVCIKCTACPPPLDPISRLRIVPAATAR